MAEPLNAVTEFRLKIEDDMEMLRLLSREEWLSLLESVSDKWYEEVWLKEHKDG